MPKVAPDTPQYAVRFVVPGTGYFTYFGTDYDRGELLTLMGGQRDSRLIDLAYVELVSQDTRHLHAQCGVCGRWFVTEWMRDQHGRRRHQDRFGEELEVSAEMVFGGHVARVRDTTGDVEERRLMVEAPLNLDNTLANRKG
jgi:hypothetical protein